MNIQKMTPEEFKKIRLDKEMTQKTLADYLGVSKSTIEKIEAGAPIKKVNMLESMMLLKALEKPSEDNKELNALEQFKLDCATSHNDLMATLKLTEEDAKSQGIDLVEKLKEDAEEIAKYLTQALKLI